MATLICNGTGNLTGASTFAAAETGAGSLALVRSSGTQFSAAGVLTSSSFTVTNTKVIDAVLLWVSVQVAGPTGTFKVDLQKGGVSQASVTVNKADLPDVTNLIPVPVLFKLSSTATGDGGANWTIVVTTTGTNAVTYYRNSATATDFTRALRTTTAATAAAGDDLYIIGELTGAGTNTSRVVTMDSTAATAYGSGAINSGTVNGGGIHVSNYGTLSYGTAASTNYILRVAGDVTVYQFGTLNEGSIGAEIPRSSTAVLELQPVSSSGDFGLIIRNNGTWNAAGLSRTSGKNVVKCKLSADLTSNNTISGSASVLNGSLTANAPNETGSVLAVGYADSVSASIHYVVFTLGSVTGNTTQTATFWIARGSGTNNRFVRASMGSSSSLASAVNGFNVDIDLQAGTVGAPAVFGNGTATSATITAVAGGYVVRLIGKISSATVGAPGLFISACSAAGTTSYTGNATQNFVIDHVNVANGTISADTSITVDTDTGWLNGDAICVASTTRTPGQCEDFVMNADASSTALSTAIYPGGAPSQTLGIFSHSGTTPTQAEVGLLTRNVKVRSTSSTLWPYVYFEPLATVNVSWTEFYYLGQSGTLNKRGIETKDGTSANTKSITFCSMRDMQNAFIANNGGLNALNVTFSNNVTFNTSGAALQLVSATAATDWTIDSNLFMKASVTIVSLGDIGGTFTNNVMSSGSSIGFQIAENASTVVAVVGTLSGNVVHSNAVQGCVIPSGFVGTVSALTVWRNGSSGLMYNSAGLTIDAWFDGLTAFGNGTNNVFVSSTNDGFNLTNSVLASDTTFTTANGINLQSAQLAQINLSNVDMSGTGSIYAPHTSDLTFSTTANTWKGTLSNCKFASLASPISSASKALWTKGAYLAFEKYNQISGDHRTEMTYGQLKTDSTLYNTASPSMRMTPNSASNKLASAPNGNGILVAVASGGTVNISVYVRKCDLGTTWNPSDTSSTSILLSNSNLTATVTAGAFGNNGIRGTFSRNAGKMYFEFTIGSTFSGSNNAIGIVTSSAALAGVGVVLGNAFGVAPNGVIWFNSGSTGITIGDITAAGTVVGIAIDLDNKRAWCRSGAGNWNADGSANPATNTNGINISSVFTSNAAFPLFAVNNNSSVTANFGASSFTNAAPSGFTSWDSGGVSGYAGNQPRLIQRANAALGQNSDVVLATYSASNGSWNALSASSSTATDDGAWEFIVDCDGTVGWINVDDWSAS